MSLTRFKTFVQAHGRWLMPELNWDLWILSKSDALDALSILDEDEVLVLGGDAFFQHRDGRPAYGVSVGNFDSFWRFTGRPDESFEAASARSKTEARRFIESYPDELDGFLGIEFGAVNREEYQELQRRKVEWDAEF